MSFRRMRHVKAIEVQGCTANFDANVPTSLYDATTGGSLVAADGAVARWEDISGGGNHVTQATSGNRPARRVASQGGFDAVEATATNACLQAASFYPSSGANDFTIICVGKENPSVTYPCWYEYGQSAPGKRVILSMKYGAAGRTVVDFHSSYIGNLSNLTGGAWATHSVVAQGASVTGDTRQTVNGAGMNENYTFMPSTAISVGTGTPLVILSNAEKAYPGGKLGVFASWSRALNASVLDRIEATMLRKYRIKSA